MKFITLLIAGIKKQKGSLIGIFLLMFIISMSLCSVFTIRSNSASYIDLEMKRLEIGDILYWEAGVPDVDALKAEIEAVKGTEKVKYEQILMAIGGIHEKDSEARIQGMVYHPEGNTYHIFNDSLDGYQENPEELNKGEIYAPISFCSIYNAKVGDTFTYKSGDTKEDYIIKGFFEDPLMGSSMMGMKRIFMTASDQQQFLDQLSKSGDETGSTYLFHVFWDKQTNQRLKEYQNELNKKTAVSNYAVLSYQRDTLNSFMLLLQNIFFGFLIAFVVILLVTAIIVIGHSISSSIEQDYVDMGILKALGFTNKSLVLTQISQYLIVVCLGLILGIFFTPAVVDLVNRMIMTVTGIVISNKLPIGTCIVAFVIILVLLALFILIKTTAIRAITPICAIRGGKKDVFFNIRLHTGIHKKGLSFWMGLRQLESGKKQYISTCFITILIVFFLSLCGRIIAWLGVDGSGLMNTMGTAAVDGRTYDFAVSYKDKEMQKEAERIISNYTKTIAAYQSVTTSGQINHSDYLLNVISNPEYFHIIEGKTCDYDNEIVITKTVSKETGCKIGDKIMVSVGDKEQEFIISGYNQCANDMGANFAMGKEAYEKLTGGFDNCYVNYVIEQQDKEKNIVDDLKNRFGKDIQIDENTWSGVDGVVNAANALEIMMYVICAIFIIIVIAMTGSKILYNEQHDLGIYKSLGFKTNHLRLMFAIRFGIEALIGSVFGIIISVFATDSFVGLVLQSLGISDFSSNLGIAQMLKPVICVILFFFLFAYVCAGKIKKTDVGILIVE